MFSLLDNNFLQKFNETCRQLDCLEALEKKIRQREQTVFGEVPGIEKMLAVRSTDISDLNINAEALKELLLKMKKDVSFYLSIIENQKELIIRFRQDGKITFVNNSYCKYFDKTLGEVMNGPFRPLIPEEDQREVDKVLSSLSPLTPTLVYEHRLLLQSEKSVEVRWLKWTGTAIFDPFGNISEIQAVGSDITINKITEKNLKQREYELERLAHHDPLTGLPNRLYFTTRLKEELHRCKRYNHQLAVMFLDLDDFKKINDSLGHDTGDLLLQEVTQQIKSCLRNSDVVSRLGGDEFIIMLSELNMAEGAGIAAEKIIDKVSKPYHIKGYELYVTVSIGIALYPSDGEDSDTIIKNADTAMYEAKARDKNNYQYYNSIMNTVTMERITMESELRKAIENREFILYYQPQISMSTGKVVGVEALIRWNHPIKGLVPPIKFIPIAEQTGLIIPISEWVLRTACNQNKAWQESGFPQITVAVNISTRQFKQPNFMDLVTDVLSASKLAPECLELEITESMVMHNVESVIEMLQKFRDAGLPISVDDFGTGYSSLNYLKRLPINKLKIDRSFVNNITSDKNDAMIVKTVIEMAHNLKLKVIAEGVETSGHAEFLRKLSCDELQGYFFSKPLPADEFLKMWEVLRILS